LTNAVGMDAWSEDTITWNNAPAYGGISKYPETDTSIRIGVIDKPQDSVSESVLIEWDAGGQDLLMDALNNDDRVATLVMVRPDDKYQTYASLESTELGAFPIRLILQEEVVASEPPPPPTVEQGGSGSFGSGEDVINWTTVQGSGYVYSVWYSTNLLDGFQPLETNLADTVQSITNIIDASPVFYKIKAQ
jgi:hypothetical protein